MILLNMILQRCSIFTSLSGKICLKALGATTQINPSHGADYLSICTVKKT